MNISGIDPLRNVKTSVFFTDLDAALEAYSTSLGEHLDFDAYGFTFVRVERDLREPLPAPVRAKIERLEGRG